MRSKVGRGPDRWWRVAGLLVLLAGLGLLRVLPAAAQPAMPAAAEVPTAHAAPAVAPPGPAVAARDGSDGSVYLNHRRIVAFKAPLMGNSAAERAALARSALEEVVSRGGPLSTGRTTLGDAVRFEVDGTPVFYLVPEDFAVPRAGALLEAAALGVEGRLQTALREAREATDPRALARGVAVLIAATAVAALLLRLLSALRRRAVGWLDGRFAQWQRTHPDHRWAATYAEPLQSAGRLLVSAVNVVFVVLLLDAWATFGLRQFAYTRPWAERSGVWLLELLEQFVLGAAGALPGLLTALLIFYLARLATRGITLLMQRVERGDLHLGWLDRDIASPTRRIGNFAIWLFALAMAYPYLPGANSEAFKGVSVLAGLMLSLGASGVIGQVASGLSLMYSRTLRAGEYVRIGPTEGTVSAVGMFSTRIQTGMGEEVSLPNAVIFGQPVVNYSRLVTDGHFVLNTTVTIGYATPWRQVHQMLLEAAARTPGVAAEPAPYVVQTALSDFYVEYRLCAQSTRAAPRRRAEALDALHGHIQDVFNENGVQIMSPHYRSDPAEPQVVPPEGWSPGLAPPARPRPAAGTRTGA